MSNEDAKEVLRIAGFELDEMDRLDQLAVARGTTVEEQVVVAVRAELALNRSVPLPAAPDPEPTPHGPDGPGDVEPELWVDADDPPVEGADE